MRFFTIFHALLFWAAFLVSGLFVVVSVGYDLYAPFGCALTVIAVLLGAFAPQAGCALGLILLPLGGNRPGTSQAFLSIVAASGLFFGMALRGLLSKRRSLATLCEVEAKNSIIFLALLYCLFSAASLSSIPINHVLDDVRNLAGRETAQAMAFSFQQLAFSNEHSFVYSFLSVYYSALSYLLGLAICRMCVAQPSRAPRLFIGSAFCGLLMSLILGVLDYYGFIDLLPLRGLDPIVNRGGTQFRLQSTFGHSGWYAEYLTLVMPMSLIILALQAPFWARVTLILASLALGEFVLILTYQRGGWLSYPLTLIVVWMAIYIVRLIEKNEVDIARAFRRSIVKVMVSLPLTVIASLLLVIAVQGKGSVESAISPYVSRFKDIQRTGDRTDFLKAGLLIGSLHPILGAGADSFAWQFEREIASPTGSFPGRFVLPLHGSAHNVYAQTFSGKGLCGLLTLLAIPLVMIGAALAIVRDNNRSLTDKLLVLTGACFGCAFLIYGNVQEVFYVQALQFLFFAVAGVMAALAYRRPDISSKRLLVSPWICVVVILLHLVWEFGSPGHTRSFYLEHREFGCFAEESTSGGASYRWCGERSTLRRALAANAKTVDLLVEAGPLPEDVSLQDKGATPVVITLAPGERRLVQVPASAESKARGFSLIRIEASGSFIPKLIWPGSGDSRRLALKVIG